MVTRVRDLQKSCRENVITHKHRHLIVIHGIYRRLPPSLVTLVDNIVVDKRSRMKQFQTYSCILRHIPYFAKCFGNQQYKHRTHTLSSALANVSERIGEQSVRMRKSIIETTDKLVELLFYRLLYD